MKRPSAFLYVLLISLISLQDFARAFDDTVVLPKGVRRLQITSIHARFNEKFGPTGRSENMAQNLERDVTFEEFLKVREGAERRQLESFMLEHGINKSEKVGRMTANYAGNLDIVTPTLGFGITDRFSLGFGIPVFSGRSDVKFAFNPNQSADDFVALLDRPDVAQHDKSREAIDAVNNVPESLQTKLRNNGYHELGYWHETALGDCFIKAKYAFLQIDSFRLASNTILNLPTGRRDNPDILTDLPFGDGTWDLAQGFSSDLTIFGPLFLNTNFLYTYQAPARREVRLKTDDEAIAVQKKNVSYKMGDKFDAGASLQLDTPQGLLLGFGGIYSYKAKDHYNAGSSSKFYEEKTKTEALNAEAMIGYSSVAAYKRQAAGIPMAAVATYQKPLTAHNVIDTSKWQFDLKFFF